MGSCSKSILYLARVPSHPPLHDFLRAATLHAAIAAAAASSHATHANWCVAMYDTVTGPVATPNRTCVKG